MKTAGIALSLLLVLASTSLIAQIHPDTLWHEVQRLHQKKADSTFNMIHEYYGEFAQNKDYRNLALAHYWLGTMHIRKNLDSAWVHAGLTEKYAILSKEPMVISESFFLAASIYVRQSKFEESINSYKNGLEALESLKDTTVEKYVEMYELHLRGISIAHTYSGNEDAAMDYAQRALNYAHKNDIKLAELAGLITISSLFYKIDNIEDAKEYMRDALRKSLEIDNMFAASKCYTNLAIYHNKDLLHDSAFYYLNKAIALRREMKNMEGLASNLSVLASIRLDLGQSKEALVALHEAEKITRENNYDLLRLEMLQNIALVYNKDRLHSEALKWANQLIELATEKKRNDKLVDGYKEKHKALYGLGRYKESVEYLEKSVTLADSLQAHENEQNLQKLLVQYETEKKEEEIKRITSEAAVKDLLIKQRNIQLIIAVVGILSLLLFAFVIFRNYRIKSEFEVLDLKQRFYRAQINPHFLFNALGSIQGFFYDRTDPNKAAGYLSRLSKLMRQILENTFDNEVTLAEEITLMENYLEIQKVRLNNLFDYQISIDDDLTDVLIPSMITQPFLENTVEHGFKQLDSNERKGKIDINISEENNQLQIQIIDNGTGLTEKQDIKKHKSRAMEITRERLELLEKTKNKSANFEVIDNRLNDGKGVTVIINLPI